jgi:hypothetical protein
MANEPLIKLEPGGKAPVLSYNVPEPTSYSGRNFIELEYPADYFTDAARTRPPETRQPITSLDPGAIKAAVTAGMRTGFADERLFPNARLSSGTLRFVEKPNPGLEAIASRPIATRLAKLDADEVASMLGAGMRLNLYRSAYGTLTYNYLREPVAVRPRLYLIETYRLSSFLGSYGAGRIVKTFTLLPGEKTKISVKTFLKTEQERKESSSILDSVTQESADDFEQSLASEQSDKRAYAETFEYHAEAEAEASWGFGSAKASAGVKGGTSSAREEFAKNVASATQKHSARASAKRDVQVNTSYEVKSTEQEETSIERALENVNMSRTLNYVFRQMNQEFISILHLIDVRVGFFNGFAESKAEVPLSGIDGLLERFVVPEHRAEVRGHLVSALSSVMDHRDDVQSVVETATVPDTTETYLRFRRNIVSVFEDPLTGVQIPVPGVILSVTRSVMRTEGVIVEAMLGEGDALDEYARQLQELEVDRQQSASVKAAAEAARAALLNTVVESADAERARLLAALTCPCGPCVRCGNQAANGQSTERAERARLREAGDAES